MNVSINAPKLIASAAGQTLAPAFQPPVLREQLEPYAGPYSISPGAAQTLRTDGKRMTADVEIAAVGLPYADVSAVDAAAGDVREGKVIVDARGERVVGTASGSATLIEKEISANGVYRAADDGADGFSQVDVTVPQGLIIPSGFAYYNGILLPKIPVDADYKYTLIRKNGATGNYDCIQGKSSWRARTQSTLDNWQLEFANMTSVGTRQYSIPQDGSATDWGEYTVSTASYYGTAQDRKIVWSSHDITISTSSNALFKGTPAVE